jgi:hypothetical protein
MIPGLDAIHRVIKIFNDNKDAKTAKEDEARRLTERRYAKHCGAKSVNLYAAMLNRVKLTEDEVESRYPIDTVMSELHDSIDSLKYSKPDITITKEQGELVSELIGFYIDNDRTCSSINEDNLISLMSKLNASGV